MFDKSNLYDKYFSFQILVIPLYQCKFQLLEPMAIHITDDCINCGACEPECPNNAIYEGGAEWAMSDGTASSDEDRHDPISDEFFYIVPSKCTECQGFHDEPQCAAVCPVDCCLPDPDHEESEDVLLARKEELHG